MLVSWAFGLLSDEVGASTPISLSFHFLFPLTYSNSYCQSLFYKPDQRCYVLRKKSTLTLKISSLILDDVLACVWLSFIHKTS